ncbi:hypothetical protein MB02_03565 [Croceicoccus estronivorus]|nr:hypothetical protein MB02_03565 [Croceicoccus estronivorus]
MNFPLQRIMGAFCAAAIALSGSACGSEMPQGAPPAAQETPASVEGAREGHPALWKVADDDTTIYLFGTIHALPGKTQWFNPAIASALGSADELVTEIDLADAGALQTGLMQKSLLPRGQNLRDLMSDDDRLAYEKALAALGLPSEAFDRFKPWYAGLMLSMLPVLKSGYSSDAGVEKVLDAHRAPKTRTGALETAEFQLNLFDSMPMQEQLSYLRSSVDAAPEMVAMLDEMVVEWLDGDAEELADLMNEQADDPALMERLLYSRNRTWAGWIAKRLDRPGTVFLAVGAGHLAGTGSVQDVLAQHGIVSDRIQ